MVDKTFRSFGQAAVMGARRMVDSLPARAVEVGAVEVGAVEVGAVEVGAVEVGARFDGRSRTN